MTLQGSLKIFATLAGQTSPEDQAEVDREIGVVQNYLDSLICLRHTLIAARKLAGEMPTPDRNGTCPTVPHSAACIKNTSWTNGEPPPF